MSRRVRRRPITTVLVAVLLGLVGPWLAPSIVSGSAQQRPVAPRVFNLDLPSTAPDSPLRARGVVASGDFETSPFRLVGLSWAHRSRVDLAASVRFRSGGIWSDWYDLEADEHHAPDPGGGESQQARGGTDPIVVPESNALQVRVSSLSGRIPPGLRVDLVDPGQSSADAVVAVADSSAAVAAVQAPRIFTRAEWGADETLRSDVVEYGNVDGAIIHHTVTANSYSQDEVPAIIRSIYAFHVQSRGWRDIGYNFLVDRFGRIWEGRFGGVDKPVVGAHTSGYNYVSFGASAIGTFTADEPTTATTDAFARLVAWKLEREGVDPAGTTQLNGTSMQAVSGHRDANQTLCPGDRLYAKLGSIRAQAASLVANGTLDAAAVARFVDQVYSDFLGRQPTANERSAASDAVLSGRLSRYEVATQLSNTDEWIGTRVTRFYRDTLGREPDQGGLDGWVAAIKRGMPIAQAAAGFYASEEYYRGFGGGTDAGWVADLYAKLLNRPPDADGLNGWVAALRAGMQRDYLAAGFYGSPESLANRIDDLYRELLGRPAEPGGIRSWSPVVQVQGDLVLAAALAGSLEYFQRAQR